MIKYRKLYIFILALFTILVATRGEFFPADYYIEDEANAADANVYFLILWPLFLMIFFIMAKFKHYKYKGIPLPLLLLVAAIGLSVIFSEIPDVSLRRATALFMSMACTYLLVKAAETPRDVVDGIYAGLAPLVVASVIGAIFFPMHAIHHASPDLVGDWKGIFYHKNMAAYVAGFFCVLCIYKIQVRAVTMPRLILLFLGLLLMIKARSAFIFAMFPICYLITVATTSPRVRNSRFYAKSIATIFIIIFSALVIATIINPEWPTIFGTTLNNRTEIWRTLLSAQSGREIFGHGFGAVHNVGDRSVFWNYGDYRIKTLGHGHSGQLDTYAATGVVGLVAINYFLFWAIYKFDPKSNVKFFREFPVFLFSVWIVFTRSFVESNLLTPSRIDWILCSIAAFSIARWYQLKAKKSRSLVLFLRRPHSVE